jgi:Putative lumazine-binding
MRAGLSVLAAVTALCISAPLGAQAAASTDEAAVRAVIAQLFDGMRARDSLMVAGAFAPGAKLISSGMKKGDPAIDPITATEFASMVGKATGAKWDERIHDVTMQFDNGTLASVWAPYEFYLGDTLNHCGVDAFHVARLPEGWKIIALSDTHRREGCGQGK